MTTQTVTQVAAGADQTLAITSTNGLICWGRNGRGACGDSTTFPTVTPTYLTPIASTLAGATMLSNGTPQACAYVSGTMLTWCWGANDFGALGHGTPGTPSRVSVPNFVRW